MDLLVIGRKIWLYRVATVPIIVLTMLAAFYVVVIKEPEYEATSNYVLINPPPPPSQEDIAVDPALGRINTDNPFTRFSDQSAVVGLLVSRLSNEATREALSAKGADPRYEVGPSSEFSASSLLLEITGVGATPEQAIASARLVGAGLVGELGKLQESNGVAPSYRIKAQSVTAAESAQRKVSSTLRPLVGVLVLGGILLFVVVSAGEALTTLRSERGGLDPDGDQDREGPKQGKPTGPSKKDKGHSWHGRRRRRNGSEGKKKRTKVKEPSSKGAASGSQREGRSTYGPNGSNGTQRTGRQERDRGAGSKA